MLYIYVHGRGLVVVAGKSLDKIMELKELAGNRDLYDVMKKQKRKQKKIDENAAKQYEQKKKINVFEFINKKLGDETSKKVVNLSYTCIIVHVGLM